MFSNNSQSSHFSLSFLKCFFSTPSNLVFISYITVSILLLLPLCIFILHHGFRQQKERKQMSHCDVFTYHMVLMELVRVLGCVLGIVGLPIRSFKALQATMTMLFFTWYGQAYFHLLTCAERYLAVVHPMIYLRLKSQRAIRFRGFIVGFGWILSAAELGFLSEENLVLWFNICLLISLFFVVSFFNLSVLCSLIRPGPGKQGGNRPMADQSKRRAFYTILFILVTLLMRFAWCLMWAFVSLLLEGIHCVFFISILWLGLPSSLVLPLLFIYRGAKKAYSKKQAQSNDKSVTAAR